MKQNKREYVKPYVQIIPLKSKMQLLQESAKRHEDYTNQQW
jgi:hypothetical protein